MARKSRVYGKNDCTYGIHCRINDKNIMRLYDRKIALLFFQVVAEAKIKFKFSLIMKTVMGNHYHLKIKPKNEIANISKIMHWINCVFAMRYNKLTGNTGHFWRERFKSTILDTLEYFLRTGLYIARNAERANIDYIENYPFSSLIFLYKLKHPFPEFEAYRDIFEEPFPGYFDYIKNTIKTLRKNNH